jgi:hypothetical protein
MARRRRSIAQITSATEKICGRCEVVKPLSAFGKNTRAVDHLHYFCRECVNRITREKVARNPERARELARKRAAHWRERDPEASKAAHRRYLEADGGKRNREKAMRFYYRNRKKQLAKRRAWEKANPKKHTAEKLRWAKRRRDRDPIFRLTVNIRRRVSGVLSGQKNGRPTFKLLGYTPQQLRDHVEASFVPGMTWENYSEWHLDHVQPVAAFDFINDPDAVKKCWALPNLIPLWGRDNQEKASLWDGQHWSKGKPERYAMG